MSGITTNYGEIGNNTYLGQKLGRVQHGKAKAYKCSRKALKAKYTRKIQACRLCKTPVSNSARVGVQRSK